MASPQVKVGKTTSLAALTLYQIFEENLSKIYVLSESIESASHLYNAAHIFAENSCLASAKKDPNKLWLRKNIRMIEYAKTNSFIKVLSGSKSGKSGQGLTACYWDEIATIDEKRDEAWHQFYWAGKFREQPIWMAASTPQADKSSLGYAEFRKAQRVLNSEDDDPSYLPIVIGVPESEKDWKNPETWWKHLAPLGDLLNKEWYLEEWTKSQNSPREIVRFKNHCLCMWAESEDALFTIVKIEATQEKFDDESLKGQRCYVGIDGSKTMLACMVLYFPDHNKVIARYWHPRTTAERLDKHHGTNYQAYASEGHCKLTEGDLMDWAPIKAQILQDAKTYKILELGFDPEALEHRMQDFAHEMPFPIVPILPYKNHVSRPTRHMETLINGEKLKIQANPLTVDCLRHTCAEPEDKQGRIAFSRDLAKGNRFDFSAALVLALHRYLTYEQNECKVKGGIIF